MIEIIQSRNISDYKNIFNGFIDDFGYTYYHTILVWCNILENDEPLKYWNIYLIKLNNEIIGICGLYSQCENSVDELWLGWFGIVPEKRNLKIGHHCLNWMKEKALSIGCKKLMCYVDEKGKALSFYYKNNFNRIGTVEQYLTKNSCLQLKSF